MFLQVDLLSASYAEFGHRAEELAEFFYEALFARYPTIRPLFSDVDMADQARKFAQTLGTLVNGLDNPEAWGKSVRQMGVDHAGYGVKPEHFPAVGECLLFALSKVAGPNWNDRLSNAWADAYDEIARLMIEGAQSGSLD